MKTLNILAIAAAIAALAACNQQEQAPAEQAAPGGAGAWLCAGGEIGCEEFFRWIGAPPGPERPEAGGDEGPQPVDADVSADQSAGA